jgi:predicted  nucleic acid-binding Zn ribbon protein
MSFIEKDITNENQTAGQIEIETFELTVYPNPATDNATVKWNGNAKAINVLNANGQVINNQEVGQMNQINLENLAQGVYHIQVIDFQNNIHTQKLIVQ